MSSKKKPEPRQPTRILLGRVVVEEDPNPADRPELGTRIAQGLHPDGTRFHVFATLSDATVHLISEAKPTRRVTVAALVEAMLQARPKK